MFKWFVIFLIVAGASYHFWPKQTTHTFDVAKDKIVRATRELGR